jgi:hypothetical protein
MVRAHFDSAQCAPTYLCYKKKHTQDLTHLSSHAPQTRTLSRPHRYIHRPSRILQPMKWTDADSP